MPTPLAVYIHWPFCKKKFPYCVFNSHVPNKINYQQWLQAYLYQINYWCDLLATRRIKTIFFGGGTPSLAPTELIAAIISKLKPYFALPEIEITLEANPTSSEAKNFKDLRAAGVNRLSIGVQSLNDVELKFLGREHSAQEAIKTIELAASVFNNYSFDLIYALPNQTLSSWQWQLEQALALAAKHISLYQLTIERGTEFYRQYQAGMLNTMASNEAEKLYYATEDMLLKYNILQYEVSNYAMPDFESKHNLSYWHYHDYLGIGPGGWSRLFNDETKQQQAICQWHQPQKWLEHAVKGAQAIQQHNILTKTELLTEILMMGWRLKQPIPKSRFIHYLNNNYLQYFSSQQLQSYLDNEVIVRTDRGLGLSQDYWLVSNEIIKQVVA
ncbi:MAG: radical SAM family heme chaperone HemW [Pseudomonadota bacterium]